MQYLKVASHPGLSLSKLLEIIHRTPSYAQSVGIQVPVVPHVPVPIPPLDPPVMLALKKCRKQDLPCQGVS